MSRVRVNTPGPGGIPQVVEFSDSSGEHQAPQLPQPPDPDQGQWSIDRTWKSLLLIFAIGAAFITGYAYLQRYAMASDLAGVESRLTRVESRQEAIAEGVKLLLQNWGITPPKGLER